MKYVVLADGTRIDNCNDSTTSNSIFAVRSSYATAGAVRDSFTKENSTVIRVYNDDDTLSVTGADLLLEDGCKITFEGGKYICEITARIKSEIEQMKDEIKELQDAVIGE